MDIHRFLVSAARARILTPLIGRKQNMGTTRRVFVIGAAMAGIAAPWVARAAEPEFRLKFGNIVSGDHPLNSAMAIAGERITRETDGRVVIALFPKN